MISVVTWLWSRPGYRSTFTAEHVNRLAATVSLHYRRPHRFICVTDSPVGLAASVEFLPAWNDWADVPSPHGAANPACYRRLRAFHPDIGTHFGERFVCLDIDTVAVADLVPLWDRPEDFVIYDDPLYPGRQYCGAMLLMSAGARPQVWTDFDPKTSPRQALKAGKRGSDQAWISYRIPGEATWGPADGVYSYRRHIQRHGGRLPAGARLTVWHGAHDPWGAEGQRLDWVRANWGWS